jgi:hypothetical protein
MSLRQAAPTDAALATLAGQLQDAVTTFEGALPTGIGTVGDWPELTAVRWESLREVRRLAAMVKQPPWPRSSCLSCGGHGMYLIDVEILFGREMRAAARAVRRRGRSRKDLLT